MDKYWSWIKDTGERAVSTFITGLAVYITSAQVIDLAAWKVALGAALPAALVIVFQAVATALPERPLAWWQDALYRTLRTGSQQAIALVGMAQFDVFDASAWQMVGIAFGHSALTVVKTILARQKEGTVTPASLVR